MYKMGLKHANKRSSYGRAYFKSRGRPTRYFHTTEDSENGRAFFDEIAIPINLPTNLK